MTKLKLDLSDSVSSGTEVKAEVLRSPETSVTTISDAFKERTPAYWEIYPTDDDNIIRVYSRLDGEHIITRAEFKRRLRG
jgi:hypothetical protein